MSPSKDLTDKILPEICSRCLKQNPVTNTIRWGHRLSGTFSVKESYDIFSAPLDNQATPIWNHIWKASHCPKISHFLWLLMHRRILTWENPARKGFQGPSRCCLCNEQYKTIDRLLDTFPFISSLWDYVAEAFRFTNRIKGNATDYLQQWMDSPFEIKILNQLWTLTPRFMFWST